MSRRNFPRNQLLRLGGAATLLAIMATVQPALAQQKTGPGVPEDDSLSWHGITLYGVIDVGIQYDTHSAPFSPYRSAASGNIVRSNDYESVLGVTPSNMGQSRIGLQGTEHLWSDLAAVFQVESFFNPQSGELANSMKSLTANNGKSANQQRIGVDGSSAGQAFQTAYVGVKSERFGALTVGRQVTLLSEGMIQYDPNFLATAFGLLGGTNQYAGGGSSEDNRVDNAAKYLFSFRNVVHVGALYKFTDASGSANSSWQANVGAKYLNASLDAYFSKVYSAISASALSAAQVAQLPGLGYEVDQSVAATISDNTAYALMGSYKFDPFRFFAGYEHIRSTDPDTPLKAGFMDIGNYVLAFVTNNAYADPKRVQVYWTGARYTLIHGLDLTAAYYHVHQDAFGTGTQAGCSTTAHSTCSGSTEAISFDADYRFNVHFDVYVGAMYSSVHGGMGSGYLYSTNINPTIGARYKF